MMPFEANIYFNLAPERAVRLIPVRRGGALGHKGPLVAPAQSWCGPCAEGPRNQFSQLAADHGPCEEQSDFIGTGLLGSQAATYQFEH